KKNDLKHFSVVRVDGKPRKLVDRENHLGIYYPTLNGDRSHGLYFAKNLHFVFGFCNQIRDLMLKYRGKPMMLIFDIGIMNSNFDIEAPPFAKGTFRLKKLKCSSEESPPRIDNENRGFCKVSQHNWEKVSDKILPIEKPCCSNKARFGHWYPK
ncbi:MAG: hypothetical protein HKN25_03600, partial [Pyrinomonadaceae bacterium]|nr:hypothetical protein [Pyrinomonadaceae bacterium]